MLYFVFLSYYQCHYWYSHCFIKFQVGFFSCSLFYCALCCITCMACVKSEVRLWVEYNLTHSLHGAEYYLKN
jgi:hypothetical protein